MRGLGFGYDEIAAEVSRRYRMRPREAYRLAWGWMLDQTAARFTSVPPEREPVRWPARADRPASVRA